MATTKSPHTERAVACDHCGLPVPRGLVREERKEQFCCAACELAYETIHACGMDRFYELAREMSEEREQAVGATGNAYEDLGASAEIDATDPHAHRTLLTIRGLHCAACVWLLERLPKFCDGVIEARVSLPKSRLSLVWDPERVDLATIARRIDALGYRVQPYYAHDGSSGHTSAQKRYLVRIGAAGAIAGNVMLASVALYAGEYVGIEPVFEQLFRWTSLLLTIVLLAWPGATFFRGAIASVRTRTPHIDLPVSLGLLVGGVAGAVNTVRGSGEIYFDSITALTFFLLIGRWLQAAQHERAFDAVAMTSALTPRTARVLQPGGAVDTPIASVDPGALVEVRASETVPVDGVIEGGATDLDRSVMTGESAPVPAGVGEPVSAGDINATSSIIVRVEHAGRATRLAQLMSLVEDAMDRRAPVQILADRVAGVFVVVVIALSIATFGVWSLIDVSQAVSSTTALLIVTCPCALGLATPLTVAIGLGRAARAGIFIKGGDVLERLAGSGSIVFDKTGTLTEGRCTLTGWYGDASLRDPVARAEASCDHPVARALSEGLDPTSTPPVEITHSAGRGIVALVDGMVLTIGSERFLREQGIAPPDEGLRRVMGEIASRAESPVLVARAGAVRAVASIGDALRPEAPGVVRAVRARGWEPALLSGDGQGVVDAIAQRVGIESERAIGVADPEQKARTIRRLARERTTVMVGDGVNDAAALAEASVGIAVSGGAEASLRAADVFLAETDLATLPRAFEGAARVSRTIRATVVFSITYNALCATLAILGLINPLLAAILMPASSLTVLTLARARRSF